MFLLGSSQFLLAPPPTLTHLFLCLISKQTGFSGIATEYTITKQKLTPRNRTGQPNRGKQDQEKAQETAMDAEIHLPAHSGILCNGKTESHNVYAKDMSTQNIRKD